MYDPTPKRLPAAALALLVLLALAISAAAAPAALTSFTARKVVLDSSGKVLIEEKIAMAGEKIRAESLRGDMVMIFRHDLGLLWVLAPEKKIYVAIPLDQRTWDRETRGTTEGERVRVLGREKVNGFSCTRKEVTGTRTAMGRAAGRTIWSSDRLPMILRSRTGQGVTTELRDIRGSEPAKDLFELPRGYRKVGDNMGLFLMYMRGAATGPPTPIH